MIFLRITEGSSKQADGVTRAGLGLAHLLFRIVQAHDARADRGQMRRGHGEGLAVFGIERVEALGDVAGQFHVLLLVVADWDDVCLVEKNIGRHEDGILQQPVADGFLVHSLVWDFALYCVIRSSQPTGVTQVSSQASSACSGTLD